MTNRVAWPLLFGWEILLAGKKDHDMRTTYQPNSVVAYLGAGFLEENFEGSSWNLRPGPVIMKDQLGCRL